MRGGAGCLPGRHDFSAFRALGTPIKTTVRTLYEARVSRQGDLIYIDLRGDGFLYHMARMIAGTLIRVGKSRIPAARSGGYTGKPGQLAGGLTAPGPGPVPGKG